MTIDFSRTENKVVVAITGGQSFTDNMPDGYKIDVDTLNNSVIVSSEANGKSWYVKLNSDTVTVNGEPFSGTAAELKTLLYSDVFTLDYNAGGGSVVGYPEGTKMYLALLTQSGTDAPVATVLVNTLGGTVVWARGTAGEYTGTLSGVFTNDKTIVFSQMADVGGDATKILYSGRLNDNTVLVNLDGFDIVGTLNVQILVTL